MADQIIKDAQGRIVQIIKDYGGGSKSITDGRGNFLGSIPKR